MWQIKRDSSIDIFKEDWIRVKSLFVFAVGRRRRRRRKRYVWLKVFSFYNHANANTNGKTTAIAPWFRLRGPSCSPGFESHAHHLSFFQFILLKLELKLSLQWEKDENNRKRGRDYPIKLRKRQASHIFPLYCCSSSYDKSSVCLDPNQGASMWLHPIASEPSSIRPRACLSKMTKSIKAGADVKN